MPDDLDHARAILRDHADDLLARNFVVATGIGRKIQRGARTDALCVVCSVSRKLPAPELAFLDLVPASLDGVPTDVVETGPIRALASRTERVRPAPGGTSIAHRDVTAGTLGCLVQKNGELFILSNNHVLANSNAARAGDPILQPGPHDGGTSPRDRIAVLHEFVPIRFPEAPSDCQLAGVAALAWNGAAGLLGSMTRLRPVRVQAEANLVDAALARPLEERDVSPEILEIGLVAGLGRGELGQAIQKSGRTTGLTRGRIEQTDVTVDVQYGPGLVARFTDQLLAGAMSQGGDSGSAVLDDERRLVGLLFAGSETTTVVNRIEHVFSALGVTL
jgi:hypothetical protein